LLLNDKERNTFSEPTLFKLSARGEEQVKKME